MARCVSSAPFTSGAKPSVSKVPKTKVSLVTTSANTSKISAVARLPSIVSEISNRPSSSMSTGRNTCQANDYYGVGLGSISGEAEGDGVSEGVGVSDCVGIGVGVMLAGSVFWRSNLSWSSFIQVSPTQSC